MVIPANDHSCVTEAHFLSVLIKPLQNISQYLGSQIFSCDINFSLTYSSWCVECVSALTVSAPFVCRHWFVLALTCVGTDCVSALTVYRHWLCVSPDFVSAPFVCRHWLCVGNDCVLALTGLAPIVCRHWLCRQLLCVSTDCVSALTCVGTDCRH